MDEEMGVWTGPFVRTDIGTGVRHVRHGIKGARPSLPSHLVVRGLLGRMHL